MSNNNNKWIVFILTQQLLFSIILCILINSSITQQQPQFTNEYAIYVNGDENDAQRFAKLNGLDYLGKIGSLDNHYRFKLNTHRSKRMIDDDDYKQFEDKLKSNSDVEWVQRQEKLVRVKRDLTIHTDTSKIILNDPLWEDTWYLSRHTQSDYPDMNVSGAWVLGYSGKGVSITILDDGLEHTHSDLKANYDPKASTDINDNDSDPMPRYDPTNENKHGTRCAGEVAGMANNSICSVGVAFHSGVGGIRILDGDISDAVEAAGLGFNPSHIDIYSASWGPDDNGQVVDGPGPLARSAFVNGIKNGRSGKGSIFVWASGNGGRAGDSCSCDGYTNSIYTLSISSTTELGDKPWYLEECTSTLATTYSSGDERNGDKEIVTTDLHDTCTKRHTGTSASAPLAAAIIALALEANPSLTWRDVMFITVLSARPKAIRSNQYIANKRGFLVSNRYGFGLMDAGRMVELAKNWKNVPKLNTCTTKDSKTQPNVERHHGDELVEATLHTDACAGTDNEVNYIEQVEAVVTIQTQVRGNIQVYLTSASGTRSLLLPYRPNDNSHDGFKNWAFMTVQLWGENPAGNWKLEVVSKEGVTAQLVDFYLNIHGTKHEPVNYNYLLGVSYHCHHECLADHDPCGPTEYDCKACLHFSLQQDDGLNKCVSQCPKGYYADYKNKKCRICHESCLECNGPLETNCMSCESKLHKTNTHECVEACPKGYFINENNECAPCESNCKTCQIAENNCDSCKTTTSDGKLKLINKNNFCIPESTCSKGYYKDKASDECRFCDISCAECDGPTSNDCIKCASGRPLLQNKKCVASCEDGYYLDSTNLRCFKCNSNCEKCVGSANDCQKCKAGYKLEHNRCNMITLYDDECHQTCYECFGSSNNECRLCKSDLILHNGECLRYPPVGFYAKVEDNSDGSQTTTFEPCRAHCKSCADEETCTSCQNDFYLQSGKCYEPCNRNQYRDENGNCMNCKSPCLTCKSEEECLTCTTNSYHLDGKCFEMCPNKYVGINSICEPCHMSCKTCTGLDNSSCVICNSGFQRKGAICESQCPDGTFYDEKINKCSLCNTTACELCIERKDKCIKCTYPLVLDLKTNTCKSCCSRSVYGKSSTSCCLCPPNNQYTGYCSAASNQIDSTNSSTIQSTKDVSFYAIHQQEFFVLFTILGLLAFIAIIICSVAVLYCNKPRSNIAYKRIEQDRIDIFDNDDEFDDDDGLSRNVSNPNYDSYGRNNNYSRFKTTDA